MRENHAFDDSFVAPEAGRPALDPGRWLGELCRLRYQYLGALVFAVLLPVSLSWTFELDSWLLEQQTNTIIASSLTILAALVVLRQLAALPGVRETYYLVPVMLLSFLVALAVLLLGRIEYDRYLLPSSLVLAIIWVFCAQSLARPYRTPLFAIVPGGDVSRLTELGGVTWVPLNQPTLPDFRITGVAIDLRQYHAPKWERFVEACALSGARVLDTRQLEESLTGRVEIEHLSENALGSINRDSMYLKIKHIVDRCVACLLLILALPVIAAACVAIRLDSPGPALFRQVRMGYGGRPFTLIKLRTMIATGEEATSLPELAADLQDPRVTRVGRFLRNRRIDELPQLVNVVLGEMSLIGPRPEPLPLSRSFEAEIPLYRYRHIVRPGITGWAQINIGYVSGTEAITKKLHYDFFYIKNCSPWLDGLIALRTVVVLLTGAGAR